jgi:hypothetical protein
MLLDIEVSTLRLFLFSYIYIKFSDASSGCYKRIKKTVPRKGGQLKR